MITVIDSGIANIGSVVSALKRVGARLEVTTDRDVVSKASALILPGVGAFADGMASLKRHGLVDPIRQAARAGKPVLGICLGMQLLADVSEEFGTHEGLGLVPGRVVKLPSLPELRVPNIGWCDVALESQATLFRGISDGAAFYFVHSYHLQCRDAGDACGSIGLAGHRFSIAVERGNVYGAQFHPEKSQDVGLEFLANFVARAST
jgi:imidazole glycerol-phosphate synthase subunit HisH